MESEAQFKICLKPFLEMVRLTNLSNSLDKEQVIEGFKKGLIESDICGVKSKPLLLDKLFDEVLECIFLLKTDSSSC